MDEEHGAPRTGRRTARERAADLRARAFALERQATERFEQERSRRTWVQIGVDAWTRDARRGGALLSGGLAYRVFLWQLPAALFFVCLFGVVADLADEDPAQVVRGWGISGGVATAVSKAVATAGSGRWWLLLLGAWGMLWAGRGASRAAVLVSRIAWELPPTKVPTMRASLTFSGIMLAGIVVQTSVPALLEGSLLQDVAVWIVVTIAYAAWTGFAMSLLQRGRGWTGVAAGAVLFAVGTRLLGLGSTIYFAGKLDRVDDLYGSLGASIVIMLYLYLVARLFVWGLFLNATIGGAGRVGQNGALAPASGS